MNGLPVFFDPRMTAPEQCSPSAAKPTKVVASWRRRFDVDTRPVEAVTRDLLKLAHHPAYVDGVLDGRRSNGFGNTDPDVARTLPYTTGSLLSAARYVLDEAKTRAAPIAASPTSGFHHAGYSSGGAFCTFNGLLVVAQTLRALKLVESVCIVDCDMHYGDGTDDIIDELGLRYVDHFTAGMLFHREEHVAEFFLELESVCARANACDLVLYQAGADPHIDDPLGGWLTTEQLKQRDKILFSGIRRPIVWNLAGGYQQEEDGSIPRVLEIHDNTMFAWKESR